jgi:hypothetical protein
MNQYQGSCHCGAVRFEVTADIVELTTCDCSLCVKRNAVMVKIPEQGLAILHGEDCLSLYQWNTNRAKHYFCRLCGIYVFHRKRASPDHFGVNIFCLEGFDPKSVPVRATEGANMSVIEPVANPDWPGPRDLIR